MARIYRMGYYLACFSTALSISMGNVQASTTHPTIFEIIENAFKPTKTPETKFTETATKYGIPHETMRHVLKIESKGNCEAYNPRSGASGPLQVLPSTARGYGFKGHPSELRSCEAGLEYGAMFLSWCVKQGCSSPKDAAYCHNYGRCD